MLAGHPIDNGAANEPGCTGDDYSHFPSLAAIVSPDIAD
jgi:hypothetical protein